MASIIGGIGTSHVPAIGVAYDKGRQQDPLWKPLFDGDTPVAGWSAKRQAAGLVLFCNDHCTPFFGPYTAFAAGIGERICVNNTGWGLEFLDRFQHAPGALTDLTHGDDVCQGGDGSVQQIMWLALRSALGGPIRTLHQNHCLMSATAMTVVLYEPGIETADAPSSAQLLAHTTHTANAARGAAYDSASTRHAPDRRHVPVRSAYRQPRVAHRSILVAYDSRPVARSLA
ncbi:hypothetical protein FHT08_001937 [Xanthomonas campestris]|nr:hypothetical protein [Xanthomonas sp. CFBP 8151]